MLKKELNLVLDRYIASMSQEEKTYLIELSKTDIQKVKNEILQKLPSHIHDMKGGGSPNFEELLNVPSKFLKRTYRALATKFHPDRGGNATDFSNLTAAYEKQKLKGQRSYSVYMLDRLITLAVLLSAIYEFFMYLYGHKIAQIKEQFLHKQVTNYAVDYILEHLNDH